VKKQTISLSPVPQPSLDPFEGNPTSHSDLSFLSLDRPDGIVLTLEESVRMAIHAATIVLKARNDVQFNGEQLLQAYAEFLPNLVGTANYSYQNGTIYTTSGGILTFKASGLNAGLSIQSDLNIFNGFSDSSNLKSALLKREASGLNLRFAQQQIAIDVTQSFLQVILDVQFVSISKKNLEESRERERLLKEQTRVGLRDLSDLYRQQAQTSQDVSTVLSAENRTRTDQVLFLRKLRLDVNNSYHFVEPNLNEGQVKERMDTEQELVAIALTERTDLMALRKASEAANWDVRASQGSYYPRLDLIGGGVSGAHYVSNDSVNGVSVLPSEQRGLLPQLDNQIQYTAGLYLTWTLFDRYVTRENVARAQYVADNDRLAAEDSKNQVKGDVRQAYGNYVTALQQLRASKVGLEASKKAYQVVEARYGAGSASFLDLVTAQAALVQAQSARAQALIGFQLQDKSLDFTVGKLPVE
jgi:outer membrane protein